jgi:hypothetical protein
VGRGEGRARRRPADPGATTSAQGIRPPAAATGDGRTRRHPRAPRRWPGRSRRASPGPTNVTSMAVPAPGGCRPGPGHRDEEVDAGDLPAGSTTVAKPPPLSPVKMVSAAQLTSIMATAASTALPPARRVATPASAVEGWPAATPGPHPHRPSVGGGARSATGGGARETRHGGRPRWEQPGWTRSPGGAPARGGPVGPARRSRPAADLICRPRLTRLPGCFGRFAGGATSQTSSDGRERGAAYRRTPTLWSARAGMGGPRTARVTPHRRELWRVAAPEEGRHARARGSEQVRDSMPDVLRRKDELWRDKRSASGSRPMTTRSSTPRRARSWTR